MNAPLLMLHGFTGGPAAWDPVLQHLPDRLVLRPALGGHGGPMTSWNEEIDRLLGLVEEAALENVHLVGYSMGGRIAYGILARRHPRITRATIVAAHPGLHDKTERVDRRRSDRAWIDRLLEGLPAFVEAWRGLPMWESQRSVPAALLDARHAIRMSHDPAGLQHALSAYGLGTMPPLRPARIASPVSLVVGALDTKHRVLSTTLASQLRRARLHVVPEVGHDVTLEAPQTLARLIGMSEPT